METTGLADPAPIAQTLMADDDLFRMYPLDGIVTTVDAKGLGQQLDSHDEPARQIAVADRMVLTKTDLVAPKDVANVAWLLGELNPAAQVVTAVKGGTT